MAANRGTCRSTRPTIGAILFSGLLLSAWCAMGHTQARTQLSGVTPCESEDRSLRSQLADWRVSENVPETLRVGDKLVLSFSSLSSALPVAVFLVVTTPEQVRFQGEYRTVILPARYGDDATELVVGPGFVAVPPNIVAPDRLEHGKDRMRAIAPLHHHGLPGFELPNTRTIGVEPLKAGPFAIEWSLVARSACGERVVSGPQKRELAVRLGRPQFVVQDLTAVDAEPAAPQPAKRKSFNIKSGGANKAEDTKAGAGRNAISAEASKKDDALPERPQRVILSNSGAYALHVFRDRYEVLDAATGVRLIAGSGYFPNFSPTSRFVTARTGGTGEDDADVDIVDLLAGRVTLNITGPTVAWSHGDSMLLSGGTELQKLTLAMPLIDRAPAPNQKEDARPHTIESQGTGRQADAWNNVNVFVSYVGSSVIVYSFDTQIVTSLVDGISRIYGDTLDLFGLQQPDEFKTVIERAVGQQDFRLPWGWHGDASMGLSIRCGTCDSKEARSDFDGGKPLPLVNGLQPRPFQRDLFVAHRRSADRQEKAKGATTASRLAARNSAIQARSNWTGAGATISQGGDIAARLAEFGLPLAAHSVSQTQRLAGLATFPASDFRGKYPKALKDRISAVLMSLDWGNAFLAGHWTFKLADRTLHLLQHGRWPAFGSETDHLVAVAYDEHPDGTIGNIRLLSELLGQPGSENAVLRDGFLIAKHWTAQMVRIRITQHQDGKLVVGVPARHRIAILDTATMKVKLVEPIQQAELMTHAALTEDGRTVVQINQNGQFFAYEVATSRLVVSGRHADGELIMHDEAGYFTGTYEGAHFLHLRFPGEPGLHSFHQFQSRLHRPDIIAAELKGKVGLPPPPDLAIPPTVEVQLSSAGAQLHARLTARSSEALKSVRLYQDGQLTDELPATGKDWSDIFPIKRLNSARWLSVVAVDEKGLLSQAAMLGFPSGSAIGGGTLHGVLVGIDEYDSPAFKPLQLAARDARDMAAALTANAGSYYGRVAMASLANAEALPSRVLAGVRDAVAAAVPGDTVVLFFAGHGLGDKDGQFYLATTGTNPDALKETAIPWSSLAATLQRSKARVIVLLDACHSGLAGQAAFASNDAAVAEIMSGARAPILVLAASKGRQLSLENMALGNGYFTHALKSVLGPARKWHDLNGNRVLEISELYRGVKAEVVSATSGQQTPWLARSDLIGDFSVF